MQPTSNPDTYPDIVVSASAYDRLSDMAAAASARSPHVARQLLRELDRATIVSDGAVPAGIVQIGSTVRYQTDDAEPREVRLTLPIDADIAKGAVSILTPVGAALLGLSEGQAIEFVAPQGERHSLRVLAVRPPA